MRRIGYKDSVTGKSYSFITDNVKLSAPTIPDIYKRRWQVEFFNRVKQHLKIKSFVGTSKNAVMTQIWIAVCVSLFLAFLKFKSKLTKSLRQWLRILQLNLFEKRDLMAFLPGDPHRNNGVSLAHRILSITRPRIIFYTISYISFKGISFDMLVEGKKIFITVN